MVNQQDLSGKLYPSYPNFLRRNSTQGRSTIINRLSEITGASKSSVREELLPLLIALHSESSEVGNIDDFTISIDLGLTGNEHAALCGLPKTRKSTKELPSSSNVGASEKSTVSHKKLDEKQDDDVVQVEDQQPKKGQRTLF